MQCSIVNYSQLDKSIFRLEAEFYNSSSFLNIDCYTGKEIIDFVQYGTSKELNEEKQGFPTLRLNEFESFFIKHPQKYCNKIDSDIYKALSLKKGDVLICRTNGNPKLVGKSAIVPEDYNYAFASYLFRIRPQQEKILPTILITYLNSSIGRAEIEKYLMVSNQANFSPAKFREISIPKFGRKIQSMIDVLVWESFGNHKKAIQFYQQAESLLLTELGLTNWQPKHRLSFVKNYSEADQSGRYDAEYFQPKYEEIVKVIKNYKVGWDTLGNLLNIKDKNFNPVDNKEYRYIELANIGGNGEVTGHTTAEGQELPTRARRKVCANDVIVSSIEGSLSSIALITRECDNALCSTGFYVVNSDDINSETLLVLLKSQVGQLQLKKGCSGTILTAINKDEFGRIVLPVVDKKIQSKIQQKIIESFALRKQSKHLLECAKKAVEMAIEKDEKIALQWLKKQTKNN